MANRITQLTTEILETGVPWARISQFAAEIVVDDDPSATLSQLLAEVLADDDPKVRTSQLCAEILYEFAMARVSQFGVEILVDDDPTPHVSQLVAEVLYQYPSPPFPEFTMSNLIFPTLPGLQWNVKKSPQFHTTISNYQQRLQTAHSHHGFTISRVSFLRSQSWYMKLL